MEDTMRDKGDAMREKGNAINHKRLVEGDALLSKMGGGADPTSWGSPGDIEELLWGGIATLQIR